MMKSLITFEDNSYLIDAGSFIHSAPNQFAKIEITESDGTKLSVVLKFIYNINAKDATFEFSQQDIYTLILTIKHNGIILNHGYPSPVSLGTFDKHELLFNLRVNINSPEDCPKVSYSWYKGKLIAE